MSASDHMALQFFGGVLMIIVGGIALPIVAWLTEHWSERATRIASWLMWSWVFLWALPPLSKLFVFVVFS